MTAMLGNIGVRGRLFLSFLGISGLALLGAVVALIAFKDVGSLIDRVMRERMPASLAALELSRQAERIAAATPNLTLANHDGLRGCGQALISIHRALEPIPLIGITCGVRPQGQMR